MALERDSEFPFFSCASSWCLWFDPQPVTQRTRFYGHVCSKKNESFKFFNGILLKLIKSLSTILVVS